MAPRRLPPLRHRAGAASTVAARTRRRATATPLGLRGDRRRNCCTVGSSPALRRLVGTEGNESEALGGETGPRVEFAFYLARPCLLESVGVLIWEFSLPTWFFFGDFT